MSYQPFLPLSSIYNSTPPVAVDGQPIDSQADINGNTLMSLATLGAGENLTDKVLGITRKPTAGLIYSASLYAPMTQVTKANIKSSAGNVHSAYISNDSATVRYFQIHNKATAPAAADVPLMSIKIPAGSANNPGTLFLDETFFLGKYCTLGIGWAVSTTFATFTDSATNTEHIVEIMWS